MDHRDVLIEIANGCETSAKLAQELAANCHPESAHSPEWFFGWRAAMLATAEQCRLTATRDVPAPELRVVR